MIDLVVQVVIGLTGCLALLLALSDGSVARRAAPIVGLLGQPFWFYATWSSAQWGMFAVTLAYTVIWGRDWWRKWG